MPSPLYKQQAVVDLLGTRQTTFEILAKVIIFPLKLFLLNAGKDREVI